MGDYYNMWKNLDMDLEKHDQLCEILPEFYEEVYLSQQNRPDAMNYFNFVISEIHGLRVEELVNHKKQGGKIIGSFCVFVPDEITFAAGAIGIGLCAGSQFWVPDGERVLPRNICPLIKASIGAKLSATCPYYQACNMVVGETTCDGKKKAWEILKDYIPVHVMDLPQMKREKNKEAWIDEIYSYKSKVEELTGNIITSEKLKESIELVNKKRKVLKRLYNTRKFPQLPISGKDALLVTQIAFYDDPERFISKTEELCDELEKRIEEGVGVFPSGTPRLLVAGTPMAIPFWKLHHIIETSGGAVVCEETCTGTRYFENLVAENGEDLDSQIRNIADRYLKINCACFTPNHGRVDDILRLVQDYKVDGVVYFSLQFCHTYNIEYLKVEKALKQEGIPIIKIETDYSDQDTEQIKTRVEAFIEMIK